MDDVIRRRAIGRNGNIINDGNTQKRLYVRIMRLRFEWIPEKDHDIYLLFRDLRADLLVSAQRPDKYLFTVRSVAAAISFAVVPVPQRSYFSSVALFFNTQFTISAFLLSCAISAIVFFFFRINFYLLFIL